MRILVACEYSAIVRDAFRRRGFNAWSCDVLPSEGDSRYHHQCDVRTILNDGWDMMIAHPPCTYLANSGVRWLYKTDGTFFKPRVEKLKKAIEFFNVLMDAPIPKIAIENPVMHKHAKMGMLPGAYGLKIRDRDQVFQPWNFGDNESKAICLWLKGLPPLAEIVLKKPDGVAQKVWRMPPGPNRQKERSRFFPGVAEAMVKQWGIPASEGDDGRSYQGI